MKKRCPESRPVGTAYLDGYRLAFTRYSLGWQGGVADVISDPDQKVWGFIYEVSERDLKRLDDYEGWPDYYTRFQSSIHASTGIIADVWVYTVVEKSKFEPPTKEYLGIIKSASARLGFPREYASELEKVETK
jgi:gamma-glutamylcyclotransferase